MVWFETLGGIESNQNAPLQTEAMEWSEGTFCEKKRLGQNAVFWEKYELEINE